MKRYIRGSTQLAFGGTISEEFKDCVDRAIEYVNDSDFMFEYVTPDSFAAAVSRRVRSQEGELSEDQLDYIFEEASRGDFDAFDSAPWL